jgi:hypothetical protein
MATAAVAEGQHVDQRSIFWILRVALPTAIRTLLPASKLLAQDRPGYRETIMRGKTILILVLTLFTAVMSGCNWRYPDPREPVITPAANDAKATSAAPGDPSSDKQQAAAAKSKP